MEGRGFREVMKQGGAASRHETNDWTDACLVFFEVEAHASKHVWREEELHVENTRSREC